MMAVKQFALALHPISPASERSELGRPAGIGISLGSKTKTASRAIETTSGVVRKIHNDLAMYF